MESVKSVSDIRLSLAADVKGEEKLGLYRVVLKDLNRIETAAAKDFDFPLSEIRDAKSLIPDVQSTINRMEAQMKRRK